MAPPLALQAQRPTPELGHEPRPFSWHNKAGALSALRGTYLDGADSSALFPRRIGGADWAPPWQREQSNSFEAAFALHAAGALTAAEAAYRRILALDARHGEARHYLGIVLHQRGYTAEGIALILSALEMDGGSAARFNDLGNVVVQSGDYANAATAFRLALEIDGGDANVWNNLGAALEGAGDAADAESAYRSALAGDADFVPALNNLAALLSRTKREEEASLLACRAFVQPPLAGKEPKMLGIAYYRLGRIADAAACYRAWLYAEPDNAYARHQLAACCGQDVPPRASDQFVTTVFDAMADDFDAKLVGKLSYRGPEIVAALLDGQVPADGTLDVLDGGCGTGLCAPVLAPYARHLSGVDLSSGMLAKAALRQAYDDLIVAELSAYLQQRQHAFDLIVMADTLIYFGDLAALFKAVAQALRRGGTFAFTAEVIDDLSPSLDFHLAPSGRYGHSRRYLEQALAAAGLGLLRCDEVVLRQEFARPTPGLGMLAAVIAG